MRISQFSVLRLYSYYKTAAIRYLKTIFVLLAFSCLVATFVVLASPATTTTDSSVPQNGGGGGCWDKKVQMEQAKKNYIMRRFISYCKPVNNF
jgi:hypothetical protein